MSRNRTNQKQYPKEAPIAVYLGNEAEKKRRKAEIDALAKRYADGKISRLVQRIADGELVIKEPDTAA
jgi:hypothetical protein